MTTKKIEQKKAKGAKELPSLLPCPCCGSEAIHHDMEGTDLYWVACTNMCMCSVGHSTREVAAKAWNTRFPSLPSLPSVQNSMGGAEEFLLHATKGRKGGAK